MLYDDWRGKHDVRSNDVFENWQDSSFSAARMVSGDLLISERLPQIWL